MLALATTVALSAVVRSSWQRSEESRFRQEFDQALAEIEQTLGGQAAKIGESLEPLCAHDPIVDSALIGVHGGTLSSRLLSIRTRVPELRRSLGLDELLLVSHRGEILAGESERSELSPDDLARMVRSRASEPGIRTEGKIAFEAACIKKEGGVWVGLLGAADLEPLLERAGAGRDLTLSLLLGQDASMRPRLDAREAHIEQQPLSFLPGAVLRAERSRVTLRASLADLDATVLYASAGALVGALVLSFFLSKGLSAPVVRFAQRTRQAVQGTVQELPIAGGPELEEAARAFNATLADLQALRQRLKATERIAARREVARQVAHEIKNPLSPIRTSIETLRKMKARGMPEFDQYFEETTKTVLSEVSRISNLVGHFSEYARLPSPQPTRFSLEDLLSHLVELNRGLGAELVFESSENHETLADRDQVAQVVTNLIKNAIEATSQTKGARVVVAVEEGGDPRGSLLHISVTDNGPGLRPEDEAKIFEPYVTTKKEGTGLGLPISHRIAVEHGGDLTYTTPKSGGARFVFSLPISGPPTLAEPSD